MGTRGYCRGARALQLSPQPLCARFDGDDHDGLEERSAAYQRLMRDLLRAQRATLIRLRNEGRIGDEAMHRIERDLDLEESRLEI